MKKVIFLLAILAASFTMATAQKKTTQDPHLQIVQSLPRQGCFPVTPKIITTGDSILQIRADTITNVSARFNISDDTSTFMTVRIFHKITGVKGWAYYDLFYRLGKIPFNGVLPTEAEKIAAIESKTSLVITQ